jgi:uncharacterized phage protein (TIGR02220 family)
MKDDLPYFSHDNDSRNHAKMKALRARYGWAGYGNFWALNEMISGSSHATLDLSRKVIKSATACELGMTPDALDDFLAFLADDCECGLINYEDGILTTDRTTEDYEKVVKMRDGWREKKTKKPVNDGFQGEKESFQGENEDFPSGNGNRGEERKEKEIKEYNNKQKYPYHDVLDYLNSKTSKHFKPTESNNRHIVARFNDGFTLEDMKSVIDFKCLKWLNDPKMSQYLQPSTLFGSKFDGYLNASPKYKPMPSKPELPTCPLCETKQTQQKIDIGLNYCHHCREWSFDANERIGNGQV